jgi:SAM-dependent methyltransferase
MNDVVANSAEKGVLPEERPAVEAYLRSLYVGVFTDTAIDTHVESHVGFAFANYAVELISLTQPRGARVVDIGSGFGSFVLAARSAGYDAMGLEIAPFEVEFARRRLARLHPSEPSEEVYLLGDATTFAMAAGSIDVVTFWNVLEHVDRYEPILAAAHRMLKPGGSLYVICPNYLAWRQEAHYHVPWTPWHALAGRTHASRYLRSIGKDPRYLESSIFFRTNWGVQRALRRLGMDLYDLTNRYRTSPSASMARYALHQPRELLRFHSPFRASVELAARKKG